MRTDLNLGERVSLVVDAALHNNERGHTVETTIGFFFYGRELPVPASELRQAILDTDGAAPWKDESQYHNDLRSIQYLSEGRGGMDNWGDGREESKLFFTFKPEFSNLRKGQVQAYRNYAYNLGRLLCAIGLPHLKHIVVHVTVTQSMRFEPRE